MPTVNVLGASAKSGGSGVTFPSSVTGDWTVAHANLSATAETTALKNPTGTVSTSARLLAISPNVKGILLRARYATGTSTVTTSPIVRVFAVYGDDVPSTGTLSDTGANPCMRLDTATSTAAGLTITLTTTGTADKLTDATYRYSDVTSLDGLDLKGAKYLLCLTETAANISGGADTVVELMALGLNA